MQISREGAMTGDGNKAGAPRTSSNLKSTTPLVSILLLEKLHHLRPLYALSVTVSNPYRPGTATYD